MSPSRSRLRPLLLLLALSGCHRSGALPEPIPGKAYPRTVAEALTLKQSGVRWESGEIRAHYLRLLTAIPEADRRLADAGKAIGERAHAAWSMRHEARLTCRAMMQDAAAVEGLRERDRQKYGDPDGPTFDSLVAHEREKGLSGDQVYQAIIESSQRTNNAVNEWFGLSGG